MALALDFRSQLATREQGVTMFLFTFFMHHSRRHTNFHCVIRFLVLKLVSTPERTAHASHPLLAVNLHTSSWWSTSTPPGGQPPSLLAVLLQPSSWRTTVPPSWRSFSIPPGGHSPPFFLEDNRHTSWWSTSIPPGSNSTSLLLEDNLHPSWQ